MGPRDLNFIHGTIFDCSRKPPLKPEAGVGNNDDFDLWVSISSQTLCQFLKACGYSPFPGVRSHFYVSTGPSGEGLQGSF